MSADHFSVDGTLIAAMASHKSFKPKDQDPGDSNGWVEVLNHPDISCALADNADERETLESLKRVTRCIWRNPCNDGRFTASQRNAAH